MANKNFRFQRFIEAPHWGKSVIFVWGYFKQFVDELNIFEEFFLDLKKNQNSPKNYFCPSVYIGKNPFVANVTFNNWFIRDLKPSIWPIIKQSNKSLVDQCLDNLIIW